MFTAISPETISGNAFQRIGKQWMLITAGTAEGLNTMTASWGGVGVLWGTPVVTAYVRPQRYTKEFMDRQDTFSLSFYPEEYRKELALCGSKSGREVDKVAACGFTPAFGAQGTPYFTQAELVLICKKLYVDEIRPEKFLTPDTLNRWYEEKDYHTFYIGQVVEALVNDGH